MRHRRTRDLPRTKQQFIDAGKDLVLKHLDTGEGLLIPVKIAEVVRTAGRSRGALRNIWGEPPDRAFFHDVMRELLGPDAVEADATLVDPSLTELRLRPLPETARRVRASLARRDFRNMVEGGDGKWARLWFLWLAHSSRADAREITEDVYRRFDETLVPVYEEELAARGRRMRQPFSIRDLAMGLTAVTEGFAMRWFGDATASSRERLATDPPASPGLIETVSEAVVLALTEPLRPASPSDEGQVRNV